MKERSSRDELPPPSPPGQLAHLPAMYRCHRVLVAHSRTVWQCPLSTQCRRERLRSDFDPWRTVRRRVQIVIMAHADADRWEERLKKVGKLGPPRHPNRRRVDCR
jgi:hypothetical protein